MPTLKNETKALQGYRVNGKLVWVKPGESIETGAGKQAEPEQPKVAVEDQFTGLTDDQLRDHIEDKTDKRPHHKTGRDSLLELARKA